MQLHASGHRTTRRLPVIGCAGVLLVLLGVGRSPSQNLPAGGSAPAPAPCRLSGGSLPPVRWISPEDDVDRRFLRDRCRTVGPPETYNPPGATRPSRLDSLLVVSWNVHVGGGDLIDLVTRLRSGRWTRGVPIEHFVLLLQEVHRGGDQVPPWQPGFETPAHIDAAPADDGLGIMDTGRRLGLHTFYAPSMRNGGADDPYEDRGNAILSTLPLTELVIIELPFEGQRRAAVAATVRGLSSRNNDWSLRLCSVHLDAQSRGLRLFSSLGAGRVRQARFLLGSLPPGPVVLAGDFNTWTTGPREPVIAMVRESFPLPEFLSDGSTLNRSLFFDSRVDYMFFRLAPQDRVAYRRLEERLNSDHNPLIASVPVLNLSP